MILNLINYILILMHRCRNMLLIANKVMQLCVVHAALQRLTAVNQAVNNCSWGCYDTCRRRLWLGGQPGRALNIWETPILSSIIVYYHLFPAFWFPHKICYKSTPVIAVPDSYYVAPIAKRAHNQNICTCDLRVWCLSHSGLSNGEAFGPLRLIRYIVRCDYFVKPVRSAAWRLCQPFC